MGNIKFPICIAGVDDPIRVGPFCGAAMRAARLKRERLHRGCPRRFLNHRALALQRSDLVLEPGDLQLELETLDLRLEILDTVLRNVESFSHAHAPP